MEASRCDADPTQKGFLMPFIYIHFPPFIVICSSSSLLITNIQKFISQRAVSLRLFINTMLAQNAIQQIPFFRLLLSPPPPVSSLSFIFPTTKQEVSILVCTAMFKVSQAWWFSRWHSSLSVSSADGSSGRRVLPS